MAVLLFARRRHPSPAGYPVPGGILSLATSASSTDLALGAAAEAFCGRERGALAVRGCAWAPSSPARAHGPAMAMRGAPPAAGSSVDWCCRWPRSGSTRACSRSARWWCGSSCLRCGGLHTVDFALAVAVPVGFEPAFFRVQLAGVPPVAALAPVLWKLRSFQLPGFAGGLAAPASSIQVCVIRILARRHAGCRRIPCVGSSSSCRRLSDLDRHPLPRPSPARSNACASGGILPFQRWRLQLSTCSCLRIQSRQLWDCSDIGQGEIPA